MKNNKPKILFLFLFIVFIIDGYAQSANNELVNAFKTGNSEKLGLFLSNPVEIYIVTGSETLSRAEAIKSLDSFFHRSNPNNFVILHQGGKSVYHYSIGNLRTDNGDYRVWYLMKDEKQKVWITQLRIEKK